MADHHQQQWRTSDDTNSGRLKLPPGFRFHPSDEEIITFYLRPKVINNRFTAHAIGEADINKCEPWELPEKAKMREKEWYFYSLKGLKYPSGSRANRATKAGYWKATGKDREIYQATSKKPVLVGMKKTLVFYKGRAPTGDKTDWVMHEFRLDGSGKLPHPAASSSSSTSMVMKSSSQEEWVICRIYLKSSSVKKAPTPSVDIASMVGDVEQRSMSFPLPMQFPMGPGDFAGGSNTLRHIMDPSPFFYSATAISTTISPTILPMADMGSYDLPMDTTHFQDPIAPAQPILYNQTGIGPVEDGRLMGRLDSGSTSIVLRDPRMSAQQTNVDISSVVSACLTSLDTIDTDDGTWKF